jgi:hypothetical protein
MKEHTANKLTVFFKLFLLCLFLLPILFFLYFPSKSTNSTLSELTWKQMPEFFVVNKITQNGEKGLITVRTTDGSPAFIPGDWQIKFSPHFVFAFANQEVRVVSSTTVKTIKLSDNSVSIKDVQANKNESKLAILQTNEKNTRLCILSTEQLNKDCLLLDINKPSEMYWDSNKEDLLFLKTNDNLFYTYDTSQGVMTYVEDKDKEAFSEMTSLFERPTPSPTYPRLFLNALFFKQGSTESIHHVNGETRNAITLEDGEHVLLKEQAHLNILEPATGRLAKLLSAKFTDETIILLPYQGNIISF